MTKLKSLPGMMTTGQLNQLLSQFPSNARITGNEPESISRVVYAPNGDRVLSAAMYALNRWHVMAIPGIVNVKEVPGNE